MFVNYRVDGFPSGCTSITGALGYFIYNNLVDVRTRFQAGLYDTDAVVVNDVDVKVMG